MAKILMVTVAFLWLTACGSGGGSGLPPINDAEEDASADGTSDTTINPDLPGTDSPLSDVTADMDDVPPPEDGMDLPGTDIPAEATNPGCQGEFQCPCNSPVDCLSTYCVESMHGFICTMPCSSADVCPIGWRCAQLATGGADSAFICQPPAVLCRPCKQNADCAEAAAGVGACLEQGPDGSFCATACSDTLPCPDGFACLETEVGRATLSLCQPISEGGCPCTDYFREKAFLTNCYRENPDLPNRRCTGERTCESECSALEPQPETCNGLDDDCNGGTDEDWATLLGDACTLGVGECVRDGDLVCDGDGADVVCNAIPGAAGTTEPCDYKDNDCNGVTDDAFVGELDQPCTVGVGECARSGVKVCNLNNGLTTCSVEPGTALSTDPCNGLDDNCNGITDDGVLTINGCGGSCNLGAANRGQPCDSTEDLDTCSDDFYECDANNINATYCKKAGSDADGDGFSAVGSDPALCRFCQCDCLDSNPSVNPYGTEGSVTNGLDDDCDGQIDEGGNACGGVAVLPNPPGTPCDFVGSNDLDDCQEDIYICNGQNATICSDMDNDGDNDNWSRLPPGTFPPCTKDCDDTVSSIYPGATESCNSRDDDCDGTTDEFNIHFNNGCGGVCTLTNPKDTKCDYRDKDIPDTRAYLDRDTCDDDKYTCATINTTVCSNVDTDSDNDAYCDIGSTPDCMAACNGDCNGTNAAIYPGATETCNSKDDDCDGVTDDASASYNNGCGGVCTLANAKDAPCDFVGTNDVDTCWEDKYVCNGINGTVCQNVDNDSDNDNYSIGSSGCSGDCNDSVFSVHPNAAEDCDSVDDDCDGCVDEAVGLDGREPGNDAYNGSNVAFGVTMTDCDGSSVNTISSMTLHRNASGCSADVDWYQIDYQDKFTCDDNSITIRFTSNSMNYYMCAYFDCSSGSLEEFECGAGTMVTDGPTAIDPHGYGCCCYGGACTVKLDSDTGTGGPDCSDTMYDDGKVYIKVFTPGGTSCGTGYSLEAYGK